MLTATQCTPVIAENHHIQGDDISLLCTYQSSEDVKIIYAEIDRLYDVYLAQCVECIQAAAGRKEKECFLPRCYVDITEVTVARDLSEKYGFKNNFHLAFNGYSCQTTGTKRLPKIKPVLETYLPKQTFKGIDPAYFYECLVLILASAEANIYWAIIPAHRTDEMMRSKLLDYWRERGLQIKKSGHKAPNQSSDWSICWDFINPNRGARYKQMNALLQNQLEEELAQYAPPIVGLTKKTYRPRLWGDVIGPYLVQLEQVWKGRRYVVVYDMQGRYLAKTLTTRHHLPDEYLTQKDFDFWKAEAQTLVDQLSGHEHIRAISAVRPLKYRFPKPENAYGTP